VTSEAENHLPFEAAEEIPKPANDAGEGAAAKEVGGKKGKGGPSQATLLVALAEGVDLFHAQDERTFASLDINGHRETLAVRSKDFSKWLRRQFYMTYGSVPGSQAMTDALETLESQAQFDGREEAVGVRIAEKNGAIYIDLCDPAWRAIEVTPRGWQIVAEPPVRFRRSRGMKPLPEPVRGGTIDELRRFVNVDSNAAFHLLVAWLVGALRPTGPYAILVLQGEQASAKSTTARVLRRLVDASMAPLRRAPRDEQNLMISAQNAWVLAFDNLSGMPAWLSDALCCLSTGGGYATRSLFTNDEEAIFSAQRPVLVNGIDAIAERADFLDRSMVLSLPPIADTKRQAEASFWSSFEQAAPRILGALLDGVSAALRNIASVTLPARPRMADFALWVTAAEAGLGWTPGTFMAAYSGNQAQSVSVTLEADAVAVAVRALLAGLPGGTWEGSATDLLAMLRTLVPEHVLRTRDWPQAANALTNRLRRAAPGLRATGIVFEDLARSGRTGSRGLRLTRTVPQPTVSIVSTVTSSSAASWRADGPVPTIVSAGAGHRQQAPGQMPPFPEKDRHAGGADGADDLSAARSSGAAETEIVMEVL
jgi:hypothetical protein